MQDLRFLGQAHFGIYQEDSEDEHGKHEILDGDHTANTVDTIMRQQQDNINHEAVHVPLCQNPFSDNNMQAISFTGLCEVIEQDIMPDNFGLMPEWPSGHYPIFETIRVGHRASKYVEVSLADMIWYSQAHLWCQALLLLCIYLTSEQPI